MNREDAHKALLNQRPVIHSYRGINLIYKQVRSVIYRIVQGKEMVFVELLDKNGRSRVEADIKDVSYLHQ